MAAPVAEGKAVELTAFHRAALAEGWHLSGRHQSALDAWSVLAAEGGDDGEAALKAASTAIDAGLHEQAERWLSTAQAEGCPSHEVEYVRGQHAWILGDLRAAARHLEQSARSGGGAHAWTALSVLSWHRGAALQAQALLERALEIDDGYPLACSDLANLLLLRSATDVRIPRLLRRAVTREPHRPQPFVLFARYMRMRGRETAAQEALGRARLRQRPLPARFSADAGTLAAEDASAPLAGGGYFSALWRAELDGKPRPRPPANLVTNEAACKQASRHFWLTVPSVRLGVPWLRAALTEYGVDLCCPDRIKTIDGNATSRGCGRLRGRDDDPALERKAGRILGMLRATCGESAFRRLLGAIVDYPYPIDTETLTAIASYAHGATLTWFVNQWLVYDLDCEINLQAPKCVAGEQGWETRLQLSCHGLATPSGPVELVLGDHEGREAVLRFNVTLATEEILARTEFRPVRCHVDPACTWYARTPSRVLPVHHSRLGA